MERDGHELFYLKVKTKDRWQSMSRLKHLRVEFLINSLCTVSSLKELGGGNSYAVTSDGQRFLINTLVEADQSSPMKIVLNWTSSLKKK